MGKYNQKKLEIHYLASYAMIRMLLSEVGNLLTSAVIIVVDNQFAAIKLGKELEQANIAVVIKNLKKIEVLPLNFQMGIYLHKKSDSDSAISDFLDRKEFLPILIVVGLVPEFLDGGGYKFRLDENFDTDILDEVETFNNWVISNIPIVVNELRSIDLSEITVDKCDEAYLLIPVIVALASVWKAYFRSMGYGNEYAESWTRRFVDWGIEMVESSDRFSSGYQVSEAVCYLFFQYIEKRNKIIFVPVDSKEKTLAAEDWLDVILFDEEIYYVDEVLLAKICRSLLSTVTMHQLKVELLNEGTLVCNNLQKRNFTTKKVVCTPSGEKRLRFLRLRKEVFQSVDGFCPETYQKYLANREEVNK